jgi:hypothetical protein
VAEVGQQLPSRRFHGWHCLMPFANDDGRPLGLLVLMRSVSSTAISRSTPSVPDVGKGLFAYVPAHKTRYVTPCRDNRNATFHR